MDLKKEHIKNANYRFYGAVGDNQIINPISQVDIKIVKQLIDIINDNFISDVMNNYKLISDNKILEQLKEINEKLDNYETKESDKLPYWLHFQDNDSTRILRVNLIAFRKINGVGKEMDEYGILLNETHPDVKNKPIHADLILEYSSYEKRDEDFKKLEDLIKY